MAPQLALGVIPKSRMDETTVCVKPDNAVAVRKPQEEPSKLKRKILDEDEYIEVILHPTLITLMFSTSSLGEVFNK